MSQPRLAAIVILGITTVTAAGLAYHQYQRAESLTQALADAARSSTDLAQKTRPIAATQSTTNTTSTDTADAIGEEEEIESPAENEREGGRRNFDRGEFGNRIQALMADPKYAQAFQQQQKARLDGRYADLFAQLNLPPAALSKLQNLLVEKQNSARDVFMAAREEGFSGREDREQLRELVQITQEEIDAQIRETIGEQNFAALQTYEQTGPQRAMVDQLETRLSYSGTPLNSVQAQALTTILAETATANNQGRSRGGPDFGGSRNDITITDDTIARSQGVLSSDQLESLVALQEEQAAARELSAMMRREAQAARNQLESGGSGSAPTRPSGGG